MVRAVRCAFGGVQIGREQKKRGQADRKQIEEVKVSYNGRGLRRSPCLASLTSLSGRRNFTP